jgi:hypothetical protein
MCSRPHSWSATDERLRRISGGLSTSPSQAAGASAVLLARGGGELATTGAAASFTRGGGELESGHVGQGGAPWLKCTMGKVSVGSWQRSDGWPVRNGEVRQLSDTKSRHV